MEQDPVCGMYMMKLDENLISEYKERLYYFCCPHCKYKFDMEPERFIKKQEDKFLKNQRCSKNGDKNYV